MVFLLGPSPGDLQFQPSAYVPRAAHPLTDTTQPRYDFPGPTRITGQTGSSPTEPVKIHDLVPRGYEVAYELLCSVLARVDLRQRTQLRVGRKNQVSATISRGCSPRCRPTTTRSASPRKHPIRVRLRQRHRVPATVRDLATCPTLYRHDEATLTEFGTANGGKWTQPIRLTPLTVSLLFTPRNRIRNQTSVLIICSP